MCDPPQKKKKSLCPLFLPLFQFLSMHTFQKTLDIVIQKDAKTWGKAEGWEGKAKEEEFSRGGLYIPTCVLVVKSW